jgi:hypothetical protein
MDRNVIAAVMRRSLAMFALKKQKESSGTRPEDPFL